jgi:hypothetical protein
MADGDEAKIAGCHVAELSRFFNAHLTTTRNCSSPTSTPSSASTSPSGATGYDAVAARTQFILWLARHVDTPDAIRQRRKTSEKGGPDRV